MLKIGHPRPLFRLFFGLFQQTMQNLPHIYVKNVHPVAGALI